MSQQQQQTYALSLVYHNTIRNHVNLGNALGGCVLSDSTWSPSSGLDLHVFLMRMEQSAWRETLTRALRRVATFDLSSCDSADALSYFHNKVVLAFPLSEYNSWVYDDVAQSAVFHSIAETTPFTNMFPCYKTLAIRHENIAQFVDIYLSISAPLSAASAPFSTLKFFHSTELHNTVVQNFDWFMFAHHAGFYPRNIYPGGGGGLGNGFFGFTMPIAPFYTATDYARILDWFGACFKYRRSRCTGPYAKGLVLYFSAAERAVLEATPQFIASKFYNMPLHGGDQPGVLWTGERYQRGITSEFLYYYSSAMDVPNTDRDVMQCDKHFSRQSGVGGGGGGGGDFLLPLQFVPFDDVAEFCQLLVLVIQQRRNQQNKHCDDQVDHHKHPASVSNSSSPSPSPSPPLQEKKQLDRLFDDLP